MLFLKGKRKRIITKCHYFIKGLGHQSKWFAYINHHQSDFSPL